MHRAIEQMCSEDGTGMKRLAPCPFFPLLTCVIFVPPRTFNRSGSSAKRSVSGGQGGFFGGDQIHSSGFKVETEAFTGESRTIKRTLSSSSTYENFARNILEGSNSGEGGGPAASSVSLADTSVLKALMVRHFQLVDISELEIAFAKASGNAHGSTYLNIFLETARF